MTTIATFDVVRLLASTPGFDDEMIPAGTEGYVVEAGGHTVVVDVQVNGEPDSVVTDMDKAEFVRHGRPIDDPAAHRTA